jgi:beta-mannosidase
MTRCLFSFIFVFLIQLQVFCQTNRNSVLLLKWQLGYNSGPEKGSMKWIPATVPGAVQTDIAKADNYGLWFYAENWKNYLWMEDQHFTYKASFKKPEMQSGEHLFFISKGIDYSFDIFFNGERLLKQEGMFTPVKLDLTGLQKPQNELTIIIHPIPKSAASPADRSQANRSVKPAVSYGWDWHPRLVPSGIWDETGLIIEPESALNEVQLDYSLIMQL